MVVCLYTSEKKRHIMKTITFANQKGGVGKTSTAVAVATELAKRGKTLMVDADSQGNTSTWLIDSLSFELAQVLEEKCTLREAIVETGIENLFVLPTAGVGGGLRDYALYRAPKYHKEFKRNVVAAAEVEGFDYCVIDTSPAFNPLEWNIFLASDEIVAVLELDVFSADGMESFTANIAELRKQEDLGNDKPLFNKIIFNKRDERISQQKQFFSEFQKLSGYNFYIIPVDQAVKKAQGLHCAVDMVKDVKKDTLTALAGIAEALK